MCQALFLYHCIRSRSNIRQAYENTRITLGQLEHGENGAICLHGGSVGTTIFTMSVTIVDALRSDAGIDQYLFIKLLLEMILMPLIAWFCYEVGTKIADWGCEYLCCNSRVTPAD